MAFESILNYKYNPHKGSLRSAFYLDLNLDQIISAITADFKEIEHDYFYFPSDEESEHYRREVLHELKNEALYQSILTFIEDMKLWESAMETRKLVEEPQQRQTWLLLETGYYVDAIENLYQCLDEMTFTSKGFQDFCVFLKDYRESKAYQSLTDAMTSLRKQLLSFRFQLTYDKDRFILTEEEPIEKYSAFLNKVFPTQDKKLINPFHANPNWKELEYEIYKLIKKKHPDLFKEIQSFYDQYENYCLEAIVLFRREICFYISFLQFEEYMMNQGFDFTEPTTDSSRPMYADGLYDLALAYSNMREKKPVIGNNFHYDKGEQFLVVTGPNQGGKTTFARSLGQLVFFSKMGLDVPAKAANTYFFNTILTHFSVEESIESGKGKLKEELTRLKPMMQTDTTNAFVIINELFTTAANYDACIMGGNVLKFFLGKNCYGIYVTHLFELASVDEKIVSMKAQLDYDKKQTFKIERSEAEEMAFADNQVNKYQLRYEQIKSRLKERDM